MKMTSKLHGAEIYEICIRMMSGLLPLNPLGAIVLSMRPNKICIVDRNLISYIFLYCNHL